MAEARFLQIIFNFKDKPKIDELKPTFNAALDWLRIAPNAWIVWTTSTPEQWYKRLKPKLGPKDNMYIFGIDSSVRYGWAPKSSWEWLDKKR